MAVINCPLSVDIVIADRIKKYFFLAVAVIKIMRYSKLTENAQ